MNSQFKPASNQFKERVEDSFAHQQVMKTLGVSIRSIHPGEIELEFPHQQGLTQQHGFIHAGILSTVLDSACGYAAFSLMPDNAGVLTIEFKINLLSPAQGEQFRAIGRVKKAGRNISVTEGELFSIVANKTKLVATMVGTIMSVYDRENIDK